MPPRKPDPRQSRRGPSDGGAPPKPPRRPKAPTQEIPEDLDEEVHQELGGRSPEEIYGDAYPEEDDRRSRPGPPAGESTRYAQKDDVDEDEVEEERIEPSPESTFAGPPVKLEVTAGPDEGNVRRFRGVRMVVGRGKGCDLELTDQSVSRRHVELVYGEEKGVLLRDLNSTTGTKVNGERVAERILAHHDEVQIGRTKLRFVDEMVVLREREDADRRAKEEADAAAKAEEEARAKAEAEAKAQEELDAQPSMPDGLRPYYAGFQKLNPMQQRAAVLGGSALVLMLVGVFLFALFHHSGPPAPSTNDLIANKKYDLAHVALTDGRFDDAVNLIESAEKMKPGIDVDGLLAQAKTDLAAQQSMDAAKQLIDKQDFNDARAELARTPQGTDDQQRRHSDLEQELDQKEQELLVHGIAEAIGQGNYETAQGWISAITLPALKKQLQAQLDDAKNHHEESVALEAKHKKEAAEAAARQEKAAHERRFDEAFGPVARKLDAGDYDRAVLECDRAGEHGDKEIKAKAREMKMLIPVFRREYEDGLRKAAAGSPELSVRPLRKAKKLYEEIGLEGSLGKKIDHALASAALSAAKTALGRDDLTSAVLSYKEAISLEPGNPEAKAGMNQLVKRTDQLLLDAYVQRDRDPRGAIEKYKMVMDIAPPGSPNYQKAKSQLSGLQP